VSSPASPANVDVVVGTASTDQALFGNALDNVMLGGTGNDRLVGGRGADSLTGGDGVELLFGGIGDDAYIVASRDDRVVERADEGIDTVYAVAPIVVLPAHVENLVSYDDGVQLGVIGPPRAWKLFGNALDNGIIGLDGADTLVGGVGNDTLDGGAGIDALLGGTGSDLYRATAGDIVLEGRDAGQDTVVATEGTNVRLSGNVEALLLEGPALEVAFGNVLDNILVGNALDNRLSGLMGADSLAGGAGSDRLWGDLGADTLVGGDGADTLTGGAGPDRFRFDATADSTPLAPDLIVDFTTVLSLGAVNWADRIVLDRIDANPFLDGDQAFDWIGSEAFAGLGAASAGQLRCSFIGPRNVSILGDVDGDGLADLQIDVRSVFADGALEAGRWFIL
jgi:Ca2+-binding RTX toxin-like protein